jgi:hypothetical protein
MNNHMNKTVRNWLILITLVVVGVLATLWATSTTWFPRLPFERHPPPPSEVRYDIELFYTVETIVSTINATLSIFLLIIYVGIYQKTRSEFTLGLIIFSAVLLLHALVSIPLVFRAFGFYQVGLGPFAMLPDLFSLAALAVLLYLSVRY